VSRRSPTLLCRHRYSATVSTSLSMKRRGEVCGLGGGVGGCPACGGPCGCLCRFISLTFKMYVVGLYAVSVTDFTTSTSSYPTA
jgi:hypothetical protein